MKILIAMFLLCGACFAQTPAAPVNGKPTELQQAHIDLAIKDYQIAQMQAQAAGNQMSNARAVAIQRIADVKKELGLDDTWNYDEQQRVFVKTPVPAAKK